MPDSDNMSQDFLPLQLPTSDPLEVFRYRDSLYAVDLIGAAVVEFDFFTWLVERGGATEEEIRAHFEFPPRPLDVMLTLFAANSFITREGEDGERISPTPVAKEYLATGSPWCMKPYYESLSDRPVLKDMVKVLKTGKPASWGSAPSEKQDWHAAMERNDFARMFTAAMDCRGLYLGQKLAPLLDFQGRRRMLDIGGGSGIYSCILTAFHAGLSATVLEKPPVDEITRRMIRERGCEAKVSVQPGDMFQGNWPEADVHLWSNVLHDWDVAEMAALLRQSAEQLPRQGLVIIHDAFIDERKTGPLAVAEYSALLMNVTQGKCYSTKEYQVVLEQLGFGQFLYQPTAADRGVMTAVKL